MLITTADLAQWYHINYRVDSAEMNSISDVPSHYDVNTRIVTLKYSDQQMTFSFENTAEFLGGTLTCLEKDIIIAGKNW